MLLSSYFFFLLCIYREVDNYLKKQERMIKMELRFNDFITECKSILNNDIEWVYLYKSYIDKNESYKDDVFIMSAMIENVKEYRKQLLEKIDWGFSNDGFGKSTFYQYGGSDGEIKFSSGRLQKNFDIEFEYTVAVRYFKGEYSPEVEINPELIWYGNLLPTDKGYIDEETKEVKLIKQNNEIKIKRDYLKDYLAAKKKICVMAFDNRRFANAINDISLGHSCKNEENFAYHISISKDDFDEYKYYSSIIGKVFIEPYDNPLHDHYRYFFPEKEEYYEFIIGINKQSGEPIFNTCDENKLSNFFGANKGEPHFLTPVFFSKDVLDRYTNNPDQYNVTDDQITYLNIWNIPFTVNKNNTVSVWLGDLGRIPYKEQKYWSVFNIKPKGEINKDFTDRQLNNAWNDSIRVEKKMFQLILLINKATKSKYGEQMFKDLLEGDKQLESAFILPSNNSITQYQNFLIQLNKLTIERINVTLINKYWEQDEITDSNGKRFGSRILLSKFIEKMNFSNSREFNKILKLIGDCRNKLAGHSASIPQYNKLWERNEDKKISTKEDAEYLLNELNCNLEILISELEV